VLTIGFYDGVHLGHRRTIGAALERARAQQRELVVVTFDRHPTEILRPERAPKLLTDLDQRLELFEAVGVDACFVIAFDEEAAAQSAEGFIEEVLVEKLGCAEVIVGENFHFGAGRRGDVALLRSVGERRGFAVEGLELGTKGGEAISSTRIRALVSSGEVAAAAELLGRLHELSGPVVHGEGRGGAELGFPTANLELDTRMALPADGVYAGWYRDEELDAWPAAISVGRRPTFLEGAEPLVETFLLNFDGDLYGRRGRVSFQARLRGEERFDSAEALIAQMGRDVAEADRVLAAAPEQAPLGHRAR
jgi:riboflavin kinase/FMN adenylyltransferase